MYIGIYMVFSNKLFLDIINLKYGDKYIVKFTVNSHVSISVKPNGLILTH